MFCFFFKFFSFILLRASCAELPQIIKIDDDSDDGEMATKRSRPLAVQFMFWFCGILIVVIGVVVLVYAIFIVCSKCEIVLLIKRFHSFYDIPASMDKLMRTPNPRPETNTNLMRKFSNKRFGETAGNLAPWDTKVPP